MTTRIDRDTDELTWTTYMRTHDVSRALRNLAIALRAAPHLTSHGLNPDALCACADAIVDGYEIIPIDDARKQELYEGLVDQMSDETAHDHAQTLISDWDEFTWVCEDRDARDAEED